MDLPRNTTAKRLRSGATAYYWRPPAADAAAGFTLHAEALGADASSAFSRADTLNTHLDDWRDGRGAKKSLDTQPGFGTLEWLISRYKQTPAWIEKVSERSRPDYERAFKLLLAVKRKSGGDIGAAHVNSIDAAAVDKIYAKLRNGPRGQRTRQANLCIIRAARAWDAVHRLYPKIVSEKNPFRGVEMTYGGGSRATATREQVEALHKALVAAGEPHLAAAPLICLEWLQRPENVIAGYFTWTDYRPAERPGFVRVEHHKTGEMVWQPLEDELGPFYKDLTEYLDGLDRLGVAVVLLAPIVNRFKKKRGSARPYKLRDARARVRKAARAAELPDWLTLDACRRCGLTELADAGLTEEQEMSMSGHTTPNAKRRYVARTEIQRLEAARKRRTFLGDQQRERILKPAVSP